MSGTSHHRGTGHFHCIKVFSRYTDSSTFMAAYVTLTDLTYRSRVKNSVKTAKFWSRRRQNNCSLKSFQNLFFYSHDFLFIKAFFGNRTFNTPIESCRKGSKQHNIQVYLIDKFILINYIIGFLTTTNHNDRLLPHSPCTLSPTSRSCSMFPSNLTRPVLILPPDIITWLLSLIYD